MKYLEYEFSDVILEVCIKVRLNIHLVPKKVCFKYLGFVILENGDIDGDVTHCIGMTYIGLRWIYALCMVIYAYIA